MPKLVIGLILRMDGTPPMLLGDVEDLGIVRQALGSAIEAAEQRAGRNPQNHQRARALRRLRDRVGGETPPRVM